MVEPVNYQHTLARTQIAEQLQETAKQQNLGDEKAFVSELHKIEKIRAKQVQNTEQDQEGVKVREEEQRKKGRGEHERPQNESEHDGRPAAELPDEVTDDPDHHIDITV